MCFVIAAYFKRYKVKNPQHVNVKGPVVLAMNHPNGFMDPIAFSGIIYPPRVRYLARGDAFKKGIVTWLLESLGIIPIFRIQDGGKEGLKKNDETYNIVNNLLKRNKKIIIFAEGLCIQERRLRPLKKGVPRMIFGAMEEKQIKELTVVPIGINYSDPSNFRSTLFFNIGEPIPMSSYFEDYKVAPAKTMNVFLSDLANQMRALIVNINHIHNEEVIEHLEIIYKHTYFKNNKFKKGNLEHDFIFSTHIAETINKTEENNPEAIVPLNKKTKNYLNELKKLNLKDWLVNPENQEKINYPRIIFNILLLITTLPIYIVGCIGNYIPYYLTHTITRKKVKLIEFKASFNIGIGAVLFLINYLLLFFITNTFAPSYWWGLLFIFVFSGCGAICLHLSPIRKKTKGMLQWLKLKLNQPNVVKDLQEKRTEIISDFEKLV